MPRLPDIQSAFPTPAFPTLLGLWPTLGSLLVLPCYLLCPKVRIIVPTRPALHRRYKMDNSKLFKSQQTQQRIMDIYLDPMWEKRYSPSTPLTVPVTFPVPLSFPTGCSSTNSMNGLWEPYWALVGTPFYLQGQNHPSESTAPDDGTRQNAQRRDPNLFPGGSCSSAYLGSPRHF